MIPADNPNIPRPNFGLDNQMQRLVEDAIARGEDDDDCRDDFDLALDAALHAENRAAVVALLVDDGFLVPAGDGLYRIGDRSVRADRITAIDAAADAEDAEGSDA